MNRVEKNKFYLELIDDTDLAIMPTSHSKISICCMIRATYDDARIAKVRWSEFNDAICFHTFGDSMQTNVVTYEDYQDFVYLLDTAWDMLNEKYAEYGW